MTEKVLRNFVKKKEFKIHSKKIWPHCACFAPLKRSKKTFCL